MPPKRKAAAPATESPAKRSARAPKPTVKATVVEISSGEESASDLEIVEVAEKKSKAAPKKAATKAKGEVGKKAVAEKAPKKLSKAALASQTPMPASTSTTPVPEPKAVAKKAAPKKAAPKKLLTYEEKLKQWFVEFEEAGEPGKMGGDGIESLFKGMGVSMESAAPFILAWKLGAKPGTFGSYLLDDFMRTFRDQQITSTTALKTYLSSSESNLYPSPPSKASNDQSLAQFRPFYKFVFSYIKEEGQKSLAGDMAVALWSMLLVPKYSIAGEFIEYANELGTNFKGISTDVWTQLLDFCHAVGDNLEGYNEDDAWPSTLDLFVEWRKAKPLKG